jgi:hypothetical protein
MNCIQAVEVAFVLATAAAAASSSSIIVKASTTVDVVLILGCFFIKSGYEYLVSFV